MTCFISAILQSRIHASNGAPDNFMWHMCVSYISEKGLDILSK